MSAATARQKAAKLVIAGDSRADFMPPEVRALVRGKNTRRALVGIVVLAVLIVGGGYTWASYGAVQSSDRLEVERSRTQDLLREQGKFTDARILASELDAAQAAQRVGASTEVLWQPYIDEIRSTAPAGTVITTFSVDAGSPVEPYAQASAPLQGSRIATVSITATSSAFPDVRGWLEVLETTPGFADARPGEVSQDEGGAYEVTITMHVTAELFANRFAEEAE